MTGINTKADVRMRIFKEGWAMEARGEKVVFSTLAKNAGVSRRTASRWWERREEFSETGVTQHIPRSGRPKHHSFADEKSVEMALDLCENLKEGEHVKDACQKLQCSRRTLLNHTHQELNWRLPPYSEAGHSSLVNQKRVNFAREQLTRGGSWKARYRRAAHIDHKKFTFFGLNRSHCRQARRTGSLIPLRGIQRALHPPQVHAIVAVVEGDCTLYMHADRQPMKRAQGHQLIHRTVDGEEYVRAIENHLGKWLNDRGVGLVIADCVTVNHCDAVVQAWEKFDINVYPSGGNPYNDNGGYPPYSHDCSILDGRMFGTIQGKLSRDAKTALDLDPEGLRLKRSKEVWLYDYLPSFWRKRWIKKMCANAFVSYEKTLREIIRLNGAATNL